MPIYLLLFLTFFTIGCVSFGGGYAMLPLFKEVLIGSWISGDQFDIVLAVSQATPGPFSVNVATFTGFWSTQLPFLGALVATLGLALPSFVICVIAGFFFEKFQKSLYLQTLMRFLAPVTTALIVWAGISLFKDELVKTSVTALNWSCLGIFSFGLALCFIKVKSIKIILIGMALGAFSLFL